MKSQTPKTPELEIDIVPGAPAPLVFSSFLRSRWAIQPNGTRKGEWMHAQHARLESILADPDTYVVSAVSPHDSNVCLGLLVYQGSTVVWIYVRKRYRRKRVATRILRHVQIVPGPFYFAFNGPGAGSIQRLGGVYRPDAV